MKRYAALCIPAEGNALLYAVFSFSSLLRLLDHPIVRVVAPAAQQAFAVENALGSGDVALAMAQAVGGNVLIELLSSLEVEFARFFIAGRMQRGLVILFEFGIGVTGMVQAAADFGSRPQGDDVGGIVVVGAPAVEDHVVAFHRIGVHLLNEFGPGQNLDVDLDANLFQLRRDLHGQLLAGGVVALGDVVGQQGALQSRRDSPLRS